jgi:hypothetical protein
MCSIIMRCGGGGGVDGVCELERTTCPHELWMQSSAHSECHTYNFHLLDNWNCHYWIYSRLSQARRSEIKIMTTDGVLNLLSALPLVYTLPRSRTSIDSARWCP